MTNTNRTSPKVAKLASETLRDPAASAIAKSFAASALAQAKTGKQTSAEMEAKAGKALQSTKFSADTKVLAASVVAQSNKQRGRK
ncbi:hypothetical protein [Pseudomonas sp. BP8]|uniref:hypothetical protein n=1 Tax=Pseudomonas sp. BP8 TaxID=2817864 RepID=UPI001AE86738|nr:hypothetical protein [Pseudomonas sp. BP8]MBP2261261.1 hypothetical protein [Pseudomonas sp. BP8]HDS1736251.1 hypothetical protein [Pseudomonas putida]